MVPATAGISYPHVTKTPGVCGGKAQIHAALAYYCDTREEIDAGLAADQTWAKSLP